MKNLLTAALCLGLQFIFSACPSSPEPVDECDIGQMKEIVTESIYIVGSEQIWLQNVDETKEQIDLIIGSDDQYRKYIGISNGLLPKIDFEKKTLLAGRKTVPTVGMLVKQSVKSCGVKIVYSAIIRAERYGAVTKINHFVIIPKISNKTRVTFDIQYQ